MLTGSFWLVQHVYKMMLNHTDVILRVKEYVPVVEKILLICSRIELSEKRGPNRLKFNPEDFVFLIFDVMF